MLEYEFTFDIYDVIRPDTRDYIISKHLATNEITFYYAARRDDYFMPFHASLRLSNATDDRPIVITLTFLSSIRF